MKPQLLDPQPMQWLQPRGMCSNGASTFLQCYCQLLRCQHDARMTSRSTLQLLAFADEKACYSPCYSYDETDALAAYIVSRPLPLLCLICVCGRTPIEWPRAHGDAHRRSMIQRALLHSWLMDVNPAVYTAMNPAVAVQVRCTVPCLVAVSHMMHSATPVRQEPPQGFPVSGALLHCRKCCQRC